MLRYAVVLIISMPLLACNSSSDDPIQDEDTLSDSDDAIGPTLESIFARNSIRCGVNTDVWMGFYEEDNNEIPTGGIEVELCEITALAVLGDSNKVDYVQLTANERGDAILNHEVDVMYRWATPSDARRQSWDAEFPAVYFNDGVSFLSSEDDVAEFSDLVEPITICDIVDSDVTDLGKTYLDNKSDSDNSYAYSTFPAESLDEARDSFDAGNCNMIVDYRIYHVLYSLENDLSSTTSILAEFDVSYPISSVIAKGDDQWFNVIAWLTKGLLLADELGVTSENVTASSSDPDVNELLGASGNLFNELGIDEDWIVKVIENYGNYGEVYTRNFPDDVLPEGSNSESNELTSEAIVLR